MNINKKEQELVDEVMENFDFLRCHRTMRMLDWRWAFPNNQVPSLERIKSSALSRIEGAIESAKNSKTKNNNVDTNTFRKLAKYRLSVLFSCLGSTFKTRVGPSPVGKQWAVTKLRS